MPFAEISGNEDAKRLIINELRKNKSSGTYLFYGRKGVDLTKLALSFAKALNCGVGQFDFCGKCSDCLQIERGVHPDLIVVEPEGTSIKVERMREMIIEAGSSAYSGKRKIFIIKEVNKLRAESANTILKTIEEPQENVFFLLLTNDMNVLPTIISRSVLINILPPDLEELKIDENIFKFFEGNFEDLLNINIEEINFDEEISYEKMGEKLAEYIETPTVAKKVGVIKCIANFAKKKRFISDLEKVKMAEQIEKAASGDRKLIREILSLFILKTMELKKIETLLEIKESLNYNVSTSLVLLNFFIKI